MDAAAASIVPVPPSCSPAAAPATLCDLILGAAIAADADVVWIEPRGGDRYVIDIERQGRVIASGQLDGGLGPAVIARLAFITGIDLLARTVTTGATRVRGPDATASITSTIRPGPQLRAEIHVRKHAPRAVRATAATTIAEGTQVAQYRVIGTLGSGGMGKVYEVEHATLGRTFALKVLHARMLEAESDGAAQFLREARAAARVKHANIVDVVDFGYLDDGRPYLVMELLAGQCVAELLEEALPVRQAVSIARQIATGLAAAHGAGVVHADVTASNIFVADDGSAKLVDFGLAQLGDEPKVKDGAEPVEYVFGTPSYIAPEQIRGQRATERSDQYSLGIVLYEMIAGAPPFVAPNTRDLCLKHIQAPVPELQSPHGPVPRALVDVVNRCLAKKPDARFGSTAELVQALVAVEQGLAATGWQRWLTP